MPLYEITSDHLREIPKTSFSAAGVRERGDLQRLLRNQIGIVSPDTLVIAEEFGEWEDSRRRIDLLGVDKDANLVVIELKRTEDGGHMDLQALRYAAMVSTMTFENAAEAFSHYLQANSREEDAAQTLLDFLEWDGPDDEAFAQDVRIVLVSAEFSKELTTAVLWLNSHGLNIRCVRLRPHADDGRTLLDVEQVIPLPEAEDYLVHLNSKTQEQRMARETSRDTTKYDVTIAGQTTPKLAKRNAIFLIVKYLCDNGIAPEAIIEQIPWQAHRRFLAVDGHLNQEEFIAAVTALRKDEGGQFEPHRWFCDDDELIYHDGKTYAFSNQWGGKWHEAMDNLVKAFSDQKISYRATAEE